MNRKKEDPLAAFELIAETYKEAEPQGDNASEILGTEVSAPLSTKLEKEWKKQFRRFQKLCSNPHFPVNQQSEALRKLCEHFEVSYPIEWQPGNPLFYRWEGADLQFSLQHFPFTNSLGMPFLPIPGLEDVLFCQWQTRVQDYAAFAGAHKWWFSRRSRIDSSWRKTVRNQGANHPVVNVSWEDATRFCSWLSEKEGISFRLPTDYEWSVASGITEDPESEINTERLEANMNNAANFTVRVGSFNGGSNCLKDLRGNVWEWCEDWVDKNKMERVVRGGSWRNSNLCPPYRISYKPVYRRDDVGFRCVCEL